MSELDLRRLNHTPGLSDKPAHVGGTTRGESYTLKGRREPGRNDPKKGRTARDATSICPRDRDPIIPQMPNLPPP
jgi:hypothetical protein